MIKNAPRFAYIAAASFSFILAAVVIVAFLQFGPSPTTTFVVPLIVCAFAALLFALKWPRESWRWGIILSCGFWIFFVIVFLSYLSVRQPDWLSAIRALSVLLAGMAGAGLGTFLRTTNGHH